MTINSAFTAKTTNGVSSGYALASNRFIVEVQNDSVFDGADITIETCSADTDAKYSSLDAQPIRKAMTVTGELATGMYVRLRLTEAGSSTSVNAKIIT